MRCQGQEQAVTSHRYCGMQLLVLALDTCFCHVTPHMDSWCLEFELKYVMYSFETMVVIFMLLFMKVFDQMTGGNDFKIIKRQGSKTEILLRQFYAPFITCSQVTWVLKHIISPTTRLFVRQLLQPVNIRRIHRWPEFPSQKASNTESVSMSWRRHEISRASTWILLVSDL